MGFCCSAIDSTARRRGSCRHKSLLTRHNTFVHRILGRELRKERNPGIINFMSIYYWLLLIGFGDVTKSHGMAAHHVTEIFEQWIAMWNPDRWEDVHIFPIQYITCQWSTLPYKIIASQQTLSDHSTFSAFCVFRDWGALVYCPIHVCWFDEAKRIHCDNDHKPDYAAPNAAFRGRVSEFDVPKIVI